MVFSLLKGRISTFLQGLQSPGLHFASKLEQNNILLLPTVLVPNGLVLVFQKLLIWDFVFRVDMAWCKKNIKLQFCSLKHLVNERGQMKIGRQVRADTIL